ncbi:MAG TPA: zeta toxin family protein [Candidatus Saccharimonadales bacterium]|nr:zeta toxin family protein [Candidatus Saccharimonadales bacterium]
MDDIEAWARKKKKAIAKGFIRETDFKPSEELAGIFTAGLPGAGKTEFTKELIKEIVNPPVRIDMGEIATLMEGYKPKLANKFRAGATIILERIYDEVVKNKLDFVFDGTFAHAKAIPNLQRALDHGYKVKIYYIHQDPVVAWRFTQDRELVEHRSIERTGFIDSYKSLQANLHSLCNDYKNVTISLIIKDGDNKIGDRKEDVSDLFSELPKFLTDEEIATAIL